MFESKSKNSETEALAENRSDATIPAQDSFMSVQSNTRGGHESNFLSLKLREVGHLFAGSAFVLKYSDIF